ncbi:MAG: hypothetical protein J6O54_01225 [Prevotella sp.]|nr:hypothetical protein [Prevotella sp.]
MAVAQAGLRHLPAFAVYHHLGHHARLIPILAMFFVAEVMNATPHALLMYQVMMYFYVSPALNVERLWLPTFLRTFGYAIFFATMTIYLKDLIEFPTFFMALTVSGFIRNGVGESVCSGLYSYGLRRQIADALSRGIHSDYTQVLMVAVKEMFGVMCLIGTFTLLLMLLYDVQPVRSTMKRMLPQRKLGRLLVRQFRQS